MTTAGENRKERRAKRQTARPARSALMDAAWHVTSIYRAHGTYGSEAKLARALRRRCPGFSERQYQNALCKANTLYDAVVTAVAAERDALLSQTDVAANRYPDFTKLAARIRTQCPCFRSPTYRGALAWALYIHHLR